MAVGVGLRRGEDFRQKAFSNEEFVQDENCWKKKKLLSSEEGKARLSAEVENKQAT